MALKIYFMYNLELIREKILANGSITFSDIPDLRKIVYRDGRVSREEADFLFGLRRDLLNFGNLKAWDEFFIQAICDYVLDDKTSHDSISDEKASWLVEKIGEDKYVDEVEKELLYRLSHKAKHFPVNLKRIQEHTSIAYDLGRKILSLLCRNSKTGRNLQFGINKIGCRNNKIIA